MCTKGHHRRKKLGGEINIIVIRFLRSQLASYSFSLCGYKYTKIYGSFFG
ncbi:unnamed protein product [Amoebophrya sp. A25]|nr:unnamed protein product [Amoebophrya sp. A25]|eukprot:GSA25T00018548001.1